MTIRVGIVAKCHGEPVLELDQLGHSVRARAVHADFAVVVDSHEGEGRIHPGVDHGNVEAVQRGDRLPVMHGGAAERIDAQANASDPDAININDVGEVLDIRRQEIVSMRR